MSQSTPPLRILIIEDNPDRIERLLSWLPHDVRVVTATSAGRAIGILQRDPGAVYAGIMLDHDLQLQVASEADRSLSGTDVVQVLILNIATDVPILIHSVNRFCAPGMAIRLETAGFDVSRIPMDKLTQSQLLEWLDDVRENWAAIT